MILLIFNTELNSFQLQPLKCTLNIRIELLCCFHTVDNLGCKNTISVVKTQSNGSN
jgi:hypothetical protein